MNDKILEALKQEMLMRLNAVDTYIVDGNPSALSLDGYSKRLNSALVFARNPSKVNLDMLQNIAEKNRLRVIIFATKLGKYKYSYSTLKNRATDLGFNRLHVFPIPLSVHSLVCEKLRIADGEFFEAHRMGKDGNLKYFEVDSVESDDNVRKYTRHKDQQLTLSGDKLGSSAKRIIPEFYKTPFGISDCDICLNALRCDTYSDCIFGCKYCFARDKLMTLYSAFYDGWEQGMIRPTKIETLEDGFKQAYSRKGSVSDWKLGLRWGHAIHFSTLTDPFQPVERRLGISLQFLKLVKEYDHPLIISTKSILPLEDDYVRAISDLKNVILQVSLPTSNEKVARKLEPRAPLPRDRLKVTQTYKSLGIRTVLRVQPIIPTLTDNENLLQTVEDATDKVDVMNTKEYFLSMNKKILEFYDTDFGIDIVDEMHKIGSPIDIRGAQIRANNVWALGQHLAAKELCHRNGIIHNVDASSGHTLSDQFHCCGGDGLKGFKEDALNLLCTKHWTRMIQKNGKLTMEEALSSGKPYSAFHAKLMREQFDYGWNLDMTFGIKKVETPDGIYYTTNKQDERFKKVLKKYAKGIIDTWWDNWQVSKEKGRPILVK